MDSQWVTGEVVASPLIPTSWSSLFPSLPPVPADQFCISVQHRQDPNDEVTSVHHVGDDPVQVSEGCPDPQQGGNEEAIWAIPLPLGRALAQAPRIDASE